MVALALLIAALTANAANDGSADDKPCNFAVDYVKARVRSIRSTPKDAPNSRTSVVFQYSDTQGGLHVITKKYVLCDLFNDTEMLKPAVKRDEFTRLGICLSPDPCILSAERLPLPKHKQYRRH